MDKTDQIVKVLVVDDSIFAREVLREFLEEDPHIKVVGVAKNGQEAIQMADDYAPDVITMDFQMPKLNGLEATKKLMQKDGKHPAIIMLSAYTEEAANLTFECLRAGAVDFVQKPSTNSIVNLDSLRLELLQKIYVVSGVIANPPASNSPTFSASKITKSVKAVVIGSSTGGPPLIEDIIRALPANLQVPILVVQHMPQYFTDRFARRLDGICDLKIKEAQEGDEAVSGQVLIAPGDNHMELRINPNSHKIEVHLTQEEMIHGLRPAIDVTMKSAASIWGKDTLGIVLTGMGVDGEDGARAIKALGGKMIAQDPTTAVIDSMPNAVIRAGLADEIVDPQFIPGRIIALAKSHG